MPNPADQPKTIYFAGALFSHKDLTGNRLLADAIDAESAGRYQCVLPQNVELPTARAKEIRDQDLRMVLDCDAILVNFDGAELDSGTVVEFIYAKLLDHPAVLFRSDFRQAGDQINGGEPWNLMCSFYPRTRSVLRNAMADYHLANKTTSFAAATSKIYRIIAGDIIEAFDLLFAEPPLSQPLGISRESLEKWMIKSSGISTETE